MKEPPETVGRYHIEKLIAQGGMGSLYLARDPAIDRLVVIKFLKECFWENSGAGISRRAVSTPTTRFH